MTILIIDNYDSFTYNLFQYVGDVTGEEAVVHRNDQISFEQIVAMDPAHIIVSPGPGSPDRERDFGICAQVIKGLGPKIPILGVCLGHQGMIHHMGGRVIRAPEIVHGKVSVIKHNAEGLFAGLPADIEIMRYHSLIGERETLPDCLEVTAELADGSGMIMGVRHKTWPMFGLQFHPESVGSPDGHAMMRNFFKQCAPTS